MQGSGPKNGPLVRIQCDTIRDMVWEQLTERLPDVPLVIYRVSLPESGSFISRLRALIQPDELARADRYHQPKDQQRFLVARSALRLLLGWYTGQHPADVRFTVGTNKKPVLAGFPTLHYNVSHAGNWVLIAIGTNPVGIDVEPINTAFNYQAVLSSSFSLEERRYIDESVPGYQGFYRLWTRKEALTKATTKGIDDDFYRIPSLDGTHQVLGNLLQTTHDWTVSSFSPAHEYLASVAYPGNVRQTLRFFDVEYGLFGAL